jgi:membrane protease YdiL (CAAX protease family)
MDLGGTAAARSWFWPPRVSLGILALVPCAVAVGLLGLADRLLAVPAWLVALGLPAAAVLVGVSTLLTTRKGPRFALRVWIAALAAPFRRPPAALRWAHLLLAATGEELLFRVLGLWLLGPGVVGVAVTSVAFALPHLLAARPGRRTSGTADAVVNGACYAGLYVGCGGVAPAVLAHFLRNVCLEALRGLAADPAARGAGARPAAEDPA